MLVSLTEPSFCSVSTKGMCVENTVPLPSDGLNKLARDVQSQFEVSMSPNDLLAMSGKLQKQFKKRLQSSGMCMLPSWNYTLPSGHEKGQYLALDVGGSTLRVAFVELVGSQTGIQPFRIARLHTHKIDAHVKGLRGHTFFAWMAEKIEQLLREPDVERMCGSATLSIGLSWSFPIQQISSQIFVLMDMGKGFSAYQGLIGEDLSSLVEEACHSRNLNVAMAAIINDASATLLSQAYVDSAARLSLIVGTGTNSAIHLPVSSIAREKFGDRPKEWYKAAENVIVNTELSLFGDGFLPSTRWDDTLNRCHSQPDFQPLEFRIGGLYLSELVRLICLEAICNEGLFGGGMPERFSKPYSLDTKLLAELESDATPQLSHSIAAFQTAHPLQSPPTFTDMSFVRRVTQIISRRGAAILATAIHALCSLRAREERLPPGQPVAIACTGSVIEHYPNFRENVQSTLAHLTRYDSDDLLETIRLELVQDAALIGAAIAVSCA